MEKAKDRNKHPHDNQICLPSKEGAITIYDVPRLNQKQLRPVSPDYKYLSTSPIYQPNLQQRHHRKSTVSGFSFSIWPAKSKIKVFMLLASVSRSENCIFVKPGTFAFPIPCCFMMVISKTTTEHNFQVVECHKSFCQILILKFQKDFHRIGWSRMVKFLCNYNELKQLQTERVMAACYHFPFPKMHQNTRHSSNIYELDIVNPSQGQRYEDSPNMLSCQKHRKSLL